jgi:plasmid replication initiation protein
MKKSINKEITEKLIDGSLDPQSPRQSGASNNKLKTAIRNLGDVIASQPLIEEESGGSLLRPAPANDDQPDFFVPRLWDIAIKDSLSLMDLALFRLSKKHKRKADIITHKLPHATVEVAAGAHGMASVYDYDFVLFCVSYLAEGMRLHKAGRGPMPSRTFAPHAADVLKFCRLGDGGKQYAAVEGMLKRLSSTVITINNHSVKSKLRAAAGGFRLVDEWNVLSYTEKRPNQKGQPNIAAVSVTIPDWIYKGVVNHQRPEILTVHPDYFLIDGGLARFVYRLARKAAGSGMARYSFATIHERSGSSGTAKKTTWAIRQLIKANDLPEYDLKEEKGVDGQPILTMTHRAAIPEPAPLLGEAAAFNSAVH